MTRLDWEDVQVLMMKGFKKTLSRVPWITVCINVVMR